MAKTNDRARQPPPPALSQPTFSAPPAAPAVSRPPPSRPVSNPEAKGKAKATVPSKTAITETPPQPLNPPNVHLQAPVRWVYNYDHTDPVNFGFMFPVAADSPIDLSPLNAHPVSSTLSPAPTVPVPPPAGNFPSRRVTDSSESSAGGQLQWPLFPEDQQFLAFQQQTPAGTSQQHRGFPHQNLPNRHGPNRNISDAPSVQQPTPAEEQIWFLPPYGTSAPQEFQNTPVSDSRGWVLDENSDFSFFFPGPVSSGLLLTPPLAAKAPPNLKRKRISEASSSATTLSLNDIADRQLSALCSRCKIYEKLSHFPGLCDSCLQVSFTTWPSAQGTRNENLESLVLFLMPANMEDVLLFAPPNMPRSRTWRMLPKKTDQEYNFDTVVFQDRWALSKQQAESTRLFGEDYAELANIARLYQLSLPTPNKSLEASCTVLITVCELYRYFVDVSSNNSAPQMISIPKLLNNIRTVRITIRHAFQQVQALAVSPSNSRDRQDWFPAFLSASIMAITAVIFLDIMIACPSPYKEQIWGTSWHDRIVDMRNGGYGMLVALLKANSKGINPLKIDCWTKEAVPSPFINVTPESYSPEQMSPGAGHGKKRRIIEKARQKSMEMDAERERNILLGTNSPAALQGILALKAWYLKYHDHLKQGEDMFSKSLYMLATMKPVAGLWRIFELE